jgi:hypothetical protein
MERDQLCSEYVNPGFDVARDLNLIRIVIFGCYFIRPFLYIVLAIASVVSLMLRSDLSHYRTPVRKS